LSSRFFPILRLRLRLRNWLPGVSFDGGWAICDTDAMPHALIVETLERAGARCAEPGPLIYRRLFALRPDFEGLFVMDTDGGVRAAMLTACFNVILGLLEDNPAQRVILSSSRFAHDGYGLAPEDFDLMFVAIRDTVRELVAEDWTSQAAAAWERLLQEIAAISAFPE